jgi:hypothetical protein
MYPWSPLFWPADFIPVKKSTPDKALDFISECDAKIFTVHGQDAYLHIQKSSKRAV